jgi:hypothetical protein
VHAAEPADVAALGGRATAAAIVAYLATRRWPATVAIECAAPIRWTAPNALAADGPPRDLLYRVDVPSDGTLVVEQAGRVLARVRARGLMPNRSLRVPARCLRPVDGAGGPVRLSIA